MLHTKLIFIFLCIYVKINAVPPEACFANFRWDDCGRPPQRVLYYWKPGSRCEVGTWRGCLPNLNMFHDEYECVNTCIFTARAQPEDYHKVTEKEEEVDTITNTTEAINVTSSIKDDNVTTAEDKVTEKEEERDNITDTTEAINVTSSITDDNVTTTEVNVETSTTFTDIGNTTDVDETVVTTTTETNINELQSEKGIDDVITAKMKGGMKEKL